jgi:hypothetical protein
MSLLRTVTLAALLLPSAVLADAKADLSASFEKLMAAPSFRASMSNASSGEAYVDMEFRAPDRYRIINRQGGPTMVIVGNQATMDVGGQQMNVPIPIGPIISAYRNEDMFRRSRDSMVVEVPTDSTVDGQPAKAYRYTMQHPKPASATAWVGADGNLLQLEVDGTAGQRGKVRIRYRDFGAADIRIP